MCVCVCVCVCIALYLIDFVGVGPFLKNIFLIFLCRLSCAAIESLPKTKSYELSFVLPCLMWSLTDELFA